MADKEQTIREAVQEFVTSGRLFTSVDIGNSIKKITRNMNIRNREVRDWLRANISTDPMLSDYVSEPIDVDGGRRVAMLYRPFQADASTYADRSQRALSPSDISALSPVPSSSPSSVAVADDSDNNDTHVPLTSSIGNTVSAGAKMIRKCKYTRRIQIPGDITQALGWIPGQKVDIDKIKIHSGKLNPNLKVWYDGRVSIPRSVVGFDHAPISIILKNDEIYFEKA